jgi:hypothetical protein
MSTLATSFKRTYNYHNLNNTLVVFSLPTRVYRRNFYDDDISFNMFVVCQYDNDLLDTCKKYQLCEQQRFRFRQFRPIYNEADSDNYLRIVPYVNGLTGARMDFLHFATNFLDCFAVINNRFKFSDSKTFNCVRTLKIYRKIA